MAAKIWNGKEFVDEPDNPANFHDGQGRSCYQRGIQLAREQHQAGITVPEPQSKHTADDPLVVKIVCVLSILGALAYGLSVLPKVW